MLSALITMFLIIAVGARMADKINLRQQEVVLAKLSVADAHAYYGILRRRARKTRLLRAVALLSLLSVFYVYRHRLADPPAPGAGRTAPAGVTQPAAP